MLSRGRGGNATSPEPPPPRQSTWATTSRCLRQPPRATRPRGAAAGPRSPGRTHEVWTNRATALGAMGTGRIGHWAGWAHLENVKMVYPAPSVLRREEGARLAGEIMAASMVCVRTRPRTLKLERLLHLPCPNYICEGQSCHGAQRHLLNDKRLQLGGQVRQREDGRRAAICPVGRRAAARAHDRRKSKHQNRWRPVVSLAR